MPILIGSTAIKYWFNDFNRVNKDIDYIPLEGERHTYTEGIEYLKNPILAELYNNYTGKEIIIHPNHLVTLKASHLCWDINWDKHMFDTQFLLKHGCKIDKELFFKLYDYWNIIHAKNTRSDLKMSKEDFFNNAVNYDESEHDFTHTLLNPTPIYTKVLKDNCEVELDPNKFELLSYEDKLNFVREEVYVMAFERFKHLGYKHAYNKMLKKFIINHAPMFSLLFIIENYTTLLKPKYNYIQIIEDGINRSKSINRTI